MWTGNITVLKFGSSVLPDEDSLRLAVSEIYRHLRAGHKVIAVVSAVGDTTDELDCATRRWDTVPDAVAAASLLATGELFTAASLALALNGCGVPATVLDHRQLQLRTTGSLHDANPVAIDVGAFNRALADFGVVVVPGFLGVADDGATSLLGRGGSDLTAVFIAHHLKAARCLLLKDVDGVFERDPNAPAPAPGFGPGSVPRRYRSIAWKDALRLPGELLQPKAVHLAAQLEAPFEVGSIGSTTPTRVGAPTTVLASSAGSPRPHRVALLGHGTVGAGVYEHMRSRPDLFTCVGVAVRDIKKHAGAAIDQSLFTDDPRELIHRPCDVVIELIGGPEPAMELISTSLRNGRNVITANKGVIAQNGPDLEAQAVATGARLRYSAAVGGAVPMIEAVAHLAAEKTIVQIDAVLNGTTNFILDQLMDGRDLDYAVRRAQEEGFAEADPTQDLDGTDAAYKLAIIARHAFGISAPSDAIDCTGITGIRRSSIHRAAHDNRVPRLVARCRADHGGLHATVKPEWLPADHPFASVRGERNLISITCDDGSTTEVHGKGAGRLPTAEAVLADLLDLYRSPRPREWRIAPKTVRLEALKETA